MKFREEKKDVFYSDVEFYWLGRGEHGFMARYKVLPIAMRGKKWGLYDEEYREVCRTETPEEAFKIAEETFRSESHEACIKKVRERYKQLKGKVHGISVLDILLREFAKDKYGMNAILSYWIENLRWR